MSSGPAMDQKRRKVNLEVVRLDSTLMLCERCGGTGNEFLLMWRRCSDCGGIGVTDQIQVGGSDDE